MNTNEQISVNEAKNTSVDIYFCKQTPCGVAVITKSEVPYLPTTP